MPDIKRQTAFKCNIAQIKNTKYVKKEGWEPNFLEMSGKEVNRVNVLAAVVLVEGKTITVDDGSEKINLIVFTEPLRQDVVELGDVVLIIGKPREYNDQRYIVPEIIKKIDDKKWIAYRKKELSINGFKTPVNTEDTKKTTEKKQFDKEKKTNSKQPILEDEPVPGKNNYQVIIDLIKKLDLGSGADTEEVIEQSGLKDAEKYVTTLINEGEIFETKPGKLKLL